MKRALNAAVLLVLVLALSAQELKPAAESSDVRGGLKQSKAHSRNRYPNELQGFKFYSKYFAPLLPGVSDHDTVGRTLGQTTTLKRDGWKITPYFSAKSGPVFAPVLGALHNITMVPDGVTPMSAVKFSGEFDHCHSTVSEINLLFDVYRDRFGLEYWLYMQDSKLGKKGDLFQIVYGTRRPRLPPNSGC